MTTKQVPIHVLHVVSGDLWAGAEAMLFTLAKALQDELHIKVSVIILNPGVLERKLREIGLDVTIIDESKFSGFTILKQLNALITEIQPDVLHSHRIKENIMASIIGWRHRIPSMRTQHGSQEHHYTFWQLANILIQGADWFCGRYLQGSIIAVSQPLAAELEASFPSKKVQLIENGLDISSFTSIKKATQTQIKAVNTPNFRIGIIGRLTPVKRVDLFIQTAVTLKQTQTAFNINFHIYGDGPLRGELQNLVTLSGAEDFIHFEGHCDNIPEQLGTLDALLMTSDHEGLPMTLLEAMCLQTPIIAHAVGGIPHLLNQGECGILVKQHTAAAFSAALEQLLKHAETRTQLTDKALERVKNHYSSTQTATKYLAIYKTLLKET